MFSLPFIHVTRKIREMTLRAGNLPEEERRENLRTGMDDLWDRMMKKAENYVQGPEVLRKGGHFSAASCGNWFLIAEAAGVETVPARVISVIDPVMILEAHRDLSPGSASVEAFFDRRGDEFSRLVNDLQNLSEDEVIRFDTGADGRLKKAIACGREHGGIPDFRGYDAASFGKVPSVDERVVSSLMQNPENSSPIWARKWVSPRMVPGDPARAFAYFMRPGDVRKAADPLSGKTRIRIDAYQADPAEMTSEGDLFPAEWRAFVKGGEVVAVGNYYTQIARALTPEDRMAAADAALRVKMMTERMIAVMSEASAIPHHPQYEDPGREGFDPDGVHFTADFMEVPDDEAPYGRRLILIDAGVGHLRDPAFGAHPVSFGAEKEPEGVAFSLGDVRSFDEVGAMLECRDDEVEP